MNSIPNIWVVGDIQGCCQSLQELFSQPDIAKDPDARFWFAGDLVNRGPQSLETLNYIMGLGERGTTVLGNHDLHLLAVAAGVRKPSRSDTFDEILNSPNADAIIDWLRHRPLAHFEHNHLLVHAGVLPSWSLDDTLALAAEVEAALRAPGWKYHLQKMYGNEPNYWDSGFRPNKRRRVIINALTRMRMCSADGRMDFGYKHSPVATTQLMPWFDVPNRALQTEGVTVIFGHWSTLGLLLRPDVICLDTGCVWGGQLTALRLSDRKLAQVTCEQYQLPGGEA